MWETKDRPLVDETGTPSVRPLFEGAEWETVHYIISNERIVKSEAFGSFCSCSMVEVMSSEDEDDLYSSHNKFNSSEKQ